MKLYEFPRETERLVELVMDSEWGNDDIKQEIERVGLKFKEKVVNCVKMMRSLKAQAEVVSKEAERLSNKKKSLINRADWLRSYVQWTMESMEVDQVDDDLFTVRVSKTPPSVLINDQTMIPGEYLEHGEVKVLKLSIKDALQSGKEVPGCELTTGTCLRVR